MPLEKVRKTLKIAKEPLSLETPIGEASLNRLDQRAEIAAARKQHHLVDVRRTRNSHQTDTRRDILVSIRPF
jgi:DNA-directed RNA polymerase sigma subunit (sigma70/sigma32)